MVSKRLICMGLQAVSHITKAELAKCRGSYGKIKVSDSSDKWHLINLLPKCLTWPRGCAGDATSQMCAGQQPCSSTQGSLCSSLFSLHFPKQRNHCNFNFEKWLLQPPPYLPIAPCAGLWAENQPWGSSRHCPSCRSSLQPCQRIKKRGRSILCSELMHWEWAARLIANICRARPCTGSAGGAGGPFACNWKQSRRGLHWGDNGNCTFLAMGDWAPTARC